MKINKNILFLGRSRDGYSKKVYNYLKKKFSKVKVIWVFKPNQKILIKKLSKKIDILISFRNYLIIKKDVLKNIKLFSINFHPGTPKYRGFGCANYAIYNEEKFYGVTAHLINSKIDNGKILDVKKFKLKKEYNLNKLLNITHKNQVYHLKDIIQKLQKSNFNIKNFQKKYPCNYQWSKNLGTKKKLNKFYRIDKNLNKRKFNLKLKATYYKKFKPYITIHGKKFTNL
jgi:methionyl-tRNA formyltransferase